jgi:hypothetical protein
VDQLTSAALRLEVEGDPHDVALYDVLRIERQTRDSLIDGALIGAAIGAAIFLKYYSENALCQGACQFMSGALATIGIGAGAGAGVDALGARREIVFEQLPAMHRMSVRRPEWGTMQCSVSVRVRW